MEKVYRQEVSIVAKIELALSNFINVSDKMRGDVAKVVHNELDNKKKFFFFKSHKILPEATSLNLEKLLKLANLPMPAHLEQLKRIGVTLHNLQIMSNKSTKLPQFFFSIPQDEIDLIDAWSKNSVDKESSFSPYNW